MHVLTGLSYLSLLVVMRLSAQISYGPSSPVNRCNKGLLTMTHCSDCAGGIIMTVAHSKCLDSSQLVFILDTVLP